MEAINQESVVAPGDIREAPISLTTTDTNLTGSWKFFRPVLQDRLPPCRNACPLGNDIPGLMQAILDQDLDRALLLLRRHNPLPAVTGRVCPNFCQQECRRSKHDQEVLIGCVERFVGDYGLDRPFPRPQKKRPEKAAIIGSGPAGLSAASFLATAGIQVTIFERESEPGGLLRYGIPAYRLPRDILQREIANLLHSLNITLHLDHPVHENDLPALSREFDTIFCAPGLWSSVRPPELPQSPLILDGLDLLQRINKKEDIDADGFAVIGGGNVAVDVARSLVRLGKKVDIIYRRTFEQMPAYQDEKTQALEEGVGLHEQQLVSGVDQENGKLCLNLAKAVQDNKKISAGLHTGCMHADRLVVAIGQAAHMQIPDIEGIVSGGDVVLGPSTVVQAMATGRQGARKILQGIDPSLAEQAVPDVPDLPVAFPPQAHLEYIPREALIHRNQKEPSQRCSDFREIDAGLSPQDVQAAATRCLQCGQCTGCGICWFFCPDVAISLDPDARPKVHIDMEHCKGCGLCATVCPRGIIEMEEDV